MSRTVSARVVWLTVAAFLLVNAAIIGRQILTRGRDVPANTETTPMVSYGDRVAWSAHDILGRPTVIPRDTADVLIVEVDLSRGREALELVRILEHGVANSERPPVMPFAATDDGASLRRLANTRKESVFVVARHLLDPLLGSRPKGSLAMGRVVIVDAHGEVRLATLRAGPRDLRVVLA